MSVRFPIHTTGTFCPFEVGLSDVLAIGLEGKEERILWVLLLKLYLRLRPFELTSHVPRPREPLLILGRATQVSSNSASREENR